ncbi:MAG: amidase, partial [Gammaproteobacteria bacterium]|nr:amidase [Gammaproteobacteria bacterium]
MTELVNAPLRQIAAAIASGEVTSETITRAFLDRIEAVNGPLNAVVCMDAETALKRAKNADAALKAGDLRGPLHGVPITLKDSLDTIDHVTTWGTTGRREVRPGADATCVARLRDAGAVVLGKTNTPEFTLSFETDNLVYGQTSNPYDQSLTPGGSSGGAAAIIAAGGSPFDVGTDTGGSIRLPAHFCGIVGLKPTTGRIPCTGNALPTSGLLAPLSQPGPMGRFVDDIAYTLPVMAGPDNQDPNAVDAVLHDPDAVDVDDLRIAWHADNGIRTPSADIVRAVTDAVDRLRESGHEVTESRPPGLEMAYFIMNRVFGADGGDLIEMLIEDAHTTDVSPALQNSLASHRAQPDMNQREFAQVMMLWHNYK